MRSIWDNFPENKIKAALQGAGLQVKPKHMYCVRSVWFALKKEQQSQVLRGDPGPICERCYGCTDPLVPGKECRGVVLR